MKSIFLAEQIEHPLDEIDAIATLLGIARKVPPEERYGCDISFLDEIMLPRIMELARRCQSAVHAVIDDDDIPAINITL